MGANILMEGSLFSPPFYFKNSKIIISNRRHGHAVVIHANHDRYEGTYVNGVKEGHGAMYYHTGEVYFGEWKNGVRHGGGVQILNDQVTYIGQWKEDQKVSDVQEDVKCDPEEQQELITHYGWNSQGTSFLANKKRSRFQRVASNSK
jgi:hypothetical protein